MPIVPFLGMIGPEMGILDAQSSPSPADALFPKVRQRLLALFFGSPERSYYTNELISLAQSGAGAVQRELADLSAAGLLVVRRQGNQRRYQANQASPLFPELRGLVLKTLGLADVLRAALAAVADRIDIAFVFGSIPRLQDHAASDVDLLVVSESLGYGELLVALEPALASLGRAIHPILYTPEDYQRRVRSDDGFVRRVVQQPKIWLFGQEKVSDGATR